jgi:hypothetical protein
VGRICSRRGMPFNELCLLGGLARVHPVNCFTQSSTASAVRPSLVEAGGVMRFVGAFHVPSPSATGRHRLCLSDLCVVLIAEPPLGLRVRSATWGTGSDSKFREEIGDAGAPNETLDRERRVAPWLRGGPAQR